VPEPTRYARFAGNEQKARRTWIADCRLLIVDFGILIWMKTTPQELEDRLIDFAVAVIGIMEMVAIFVGSVC